MSVNRRRHANAVPIASFLTWIVIGLFFCVAGLGYVWCKNQIYADGSQIKKLESELINLRNSNEVVEAKIAQLSSTARLQERFQSGFIKLVPISNDHLVQVSLKAPAGVASELRAVSNERTPE